MKTIVKVSALAIMAAALFASCAKEINVAEPAAQNSVRTFTLTIATDTKVAITDEGKTTWEAGDEILINAGSGGTTRETVTLAAENISADGKKATITVSIDPYDRSADRGIVSTYYALYPASAAAPGNMYYNQAFANTNAPLMAACNVGDDFVFYNICGLISFKVSGDFDSYVFSGNNGETVGYEVYQVRVRDDGDGPYCTNPKAADTYGTLTPLTKVSGNVVADGSGVNFVGLPGGAKFNGGFTFKFYKGTELVKIATTESAAEIAAGKLLVLGDISSHLEDYVAPTTSDHKSEITGATDISDKQANCYIITAPGAYKFPALKGNSDTPAGEVFGASIVWETWNGAESVSENSVIEKVDFEDNWIYFQTPETLKPGNALIAAKDINDDIIWSWHIWIPETTVESLNNGIHPTAVLDRNLGALVVTEASSTEVISIASIGLLYQWGRKDPFMGPRVIEEGTYPSLYKYAGTGIDAQKIQISIAESIKHPTLFARGLYVDGSQVDPNWVTPADGELWGDNGGKTIYDPCPAGYRVPKREKSTSLWADTMTGYEVDQEHYWLKLGDPATVFPAAGWMDGGSIKTTFRTAIWNAHSDSYTNSSGYSHYAGYARRIYVESGELKIKNSSINKSLGAAVRCVAE